MLIYDGYNVNLKKACELYNKYLSMFEMDGMNNNMKINLFYKQEEALLNFRRKVEYLDPKWYQLNTEHLHGEISNVASIRSIIQSTVDLHSAQLALINLNLPEELSARLAAINIALDDAGNAGRNPQAEQIYRAKLTQLKQAIETLLQHNLVANDIYAGNRPGYTQINA